MQPKEAMNLDNSFDFGFSFANESEVSAPTATVVKDTLAEEHKNKLAELEKLILPLLYNLMKNPEKPYIKWENRVPIIKAQIDRIIAITRS